MTLGFILSEMAGLGYQPAISTEIEFYLPSPADLLLIDQAVKELGIHAFPAKPEDTALQYEIALHHSTDVQKIATDTIKLKAFLEKKFQANFTAKPFEDKAGSGLHIHISLQDDQRHNLYAPPEDALLHHSIGGLCATMVESMIYFAPHEESYSRFTAVRNERQEKMARYNNAPVNISWGGNNRTTAIRIPDYSSDPSSRHIEHRVSGADANPEQVIAAILAGIYRGITEKISPPPRIYGNAFDAQYDLPGLPKSLEEAEVKA